MPTLDFDAARRERLRARDPISFTLGGETFTPLPCVPFAAAWDLIDAPDPTGEQEAPLIAYRGLAAFIAECLPPADTERWWALFASRDEPIDGVALREVATFLTAAYTGRPTSPSTDSSAGRPKTSRRSSSSRNGKGSGPSAA